MAVSPFMLLVCSSKAEVVEEKEEEEGINWGWCGESVEEG